MFMHRRAFSSTSPFTRLTAAAAAIILLGLLADAGGANAALVVAALLLILIGALFVARAQETYRSQR